MASRPYRLLAGELAPTRGSVSVVGLSAYLPQRLDAELADRLDELLGIAGPRRALRRILDGDLDPQLADLVGADWDVEERAALALAKRARPPSTSTARSTPSRW